jgi:hypothetical protein
LSVTATTVIASEPPIQTGASTKNTSATMEPTSRPNASRAHTYGPPCRGKAAPSSATANPAGTKNSTATIASQVIVCAPPRATVPTVSSTTIAAISRATASSRPSSRRNLDRSTPDRSTLASGAAGTTRATAPMMSPCSNRLQVVSGCAGVRFNP